VTDIELLPDGAGRASLRAVLAAAGAADGVVARGPGYDPQLWAELDRQGWLAAAAPGAQVGELAVLASELGWARVPAPLHNRVEACWMGAPATAACCVAARVVMTHELVVDGIAPFVAYADSAPVVVVLADRPDASDGPSLVVVPMDAPGVTVRTRPSLAGDRQAEVRLDHVAVSPGAVIAVGDDARDRVDRARRMSTLSRCAEAVGASAALVDRTAAHAVSRHQFGGPIGRLQAVQHRCADMVMDHLAALGAVEDAVGALEAGGDARVELAAAASLVSSSCLRVADSAHRVWGGTGYLADAGVHRWTRLLRGTAAQLGGTHAQRVALVSGLVARGAWSTHVG